MSRGSKKMKFPSRLLPLQPFPQLADLPFVVAAKREELLESREADAAEVFPERVAVTECLADRLWVVLDVPGGFFEQRFFRLEDQPGFDLPITANAFLDLPIEALCELGDPPSALAVRPAAAFQSVVLRFVLGIFLLE